MIVLIDGAVPMVQVVRAPVVVVMDTMAVGPVVACGGMTQLEAGPQERTLLILHEIYSCFRDHTSLYFLGARFAKREIRGVL